LRIEIASPPGEIKIMPPSGANSGRLTSFDKRFELPVLRIPCNCMHRYHLALCITSWKMELGT
jgi:hypothetical protein